MADPIEIVATPSDPEANSYLTLDEADDLLEGWPDTLDKWGDLEDDQRAQILMQGTRLIDQYEAWGPPKKSDQSLAFPRACDKTDEVPATIKRALAAFANYVVDGSLVPLKTLQSEGVTNASILSQNMTMEKSKTQLPNESVQELKKLVRSTWTAPKVKRDGECSMF